MNCTAKRGLFRPFSISDKINTSKATQTSLMVRQNIQKELQAETPREDLTKMLYKKDLFHLGVEQMLGKQYSQSEQTLKELYEQLMLEGDDHPALLAMVLKRISLCQMNSAKLDEFGKTLEELFLIRSSDPEVNPAHLYSSVINLLVYYLQNDLQKGLQFIQSYDELMGQVLLPLNLQQEIKQTMGVFFMKVGDFANASEYFQSIVDSDQASYVRGIAYNNLAICRLSALNSQSKSTELEEIQGLLLKSIAHLESSPR